jgi:hypothetical protein
MRIIRQRRADRDDWQMAVLIVDGATPSSDTILRHSTSHVAVKGAEGG